MTDFRALCAELVDIATAHCYPDEGAVGYCAAVLTRARAALAQPETPSRLHHCPTHGQQPENAWGCPECVREMRQQLAQSEPQGVRQEAILDWLRNDEAWGTIVAPKSWRAQDDKLLNLLLRAIAHFGRPTSEENLD